MKNRTTNKAIHSSKGKRGLLPAITRGVTVSLVITLILTAVEATLIEKGVLPQSSVDTAAAVIRIVAALLGAFVGVKNTESQKQTVASITGLVYGLTLLLITGFFYDARYSGVLKGLILVVLSATAAGILLPKSRAGKAKNYRFR